jgi:hypothetical protein
MVGIISIDRKQVSYSGQKFEQGKRGGNMDLV